MKCGICGAQWERFGDLALIGYMAGFDGEDHPVLIQHRNCTCYATHSQTVDHATVAAAARGVGPVADSARAALLDLELTR
jgi:hypothetical protein